MDFLALALALAAAPAPAATAAPAAAAAPAATSLDRKLDLALAAARASAANASAANAAAPVAVTAPALTAPAATAVTAESAAARSTAATAPLTLKPAEGSWTGLGGAALLAAVAGAAWWLTRKRSALPAGLRVVQHASLGKGRDLVVVDHQGRRLLLGVTGSGISVLRDDDAPPAPPAPLPAPAPASAATAVDAAPRLRGLAAFEAELSRAAFDAPAAERGDDPRAALLAPLSEDEALRRKLGRTA
ncbi:MAG: flagellar biosynthetic protein FliO [Deltaproteobacteria bacterium]|nr:flagellar biosynthetic protein FliO [Deltaproteobacteria bacterium]